jgi:hypothetical protein
MEADPNRRGHLPSCVPLMTLFGNPVQKILCFTSLVFARPARKNQVTHRTALGTLPPEPPDNILGSRGAQPRHSLPRILGRAGL